MSERIRGSYDDALYKSTYTLLYGLGKDRKETGTGMKEKVVEGTDGRSGGIKDL